MLDHFQAFFFAPRSASGFGLIRILWSATALFTALTWWVDVTAYFSDAGYFPTHLMPAFLRASYRFSVLDVVTDPMSVFLLYLALLVLLLLAMVGWRARWTVLFSFLLLVSFHERDPLPMAGGDTMLRLLGFLLVISPGIEALSIDRLRHQWRHWRGSRILLPPLLMPSWPYRLLLWQFIVLYGTSLWYKSLGTMWLSGTAVASVLHHPIFARPPLALMDLLAPISPLLTYLTILWHVGWLALLVPHRTLRRLLGLSWTRLKRWLLLGGLIFHGSILLLLRAGNFSIAVLSGYPGLLDEHDFNAVRRLCNGGKTPRRVTVLYDGRCGLCLRSVFVLQLLDSLHRLQCVNFWNRHAKNAIAPRLTEAKLNRAMHIKERGRFFKGFDAFRRLSWHLPALWPIAPFLSLPGIAPIGRHIYARIAARRKRCDHTTCPR